MRELTKGVILTFRKGDEKAFHEIFNHFYPGLYFFTRKLTGSREEAEDITLRSFYKLYERGHSFETQTQIKAFLYISAKNSCFNYLRSQKQHAKFLQTKYARKLGPASQNHYEYEIIDERTKLNAAVEKLPRECRKIFRMLYYDGLKPKEIATALRISIRTVYNQQQLGLKALRMAVTSAELWP